ncbi:hypothetical protein [Alicyclobacillus fodiniaquatilis]|jgi:hypothetical protein|uniref:Uncharacterized protein n=1 Tax=Alicyclobacillus fodiniaquatilis TaxID=1661150 RepID=A0ABW4JG55_9BACL
MIDDGILGNIVERVSIFPTSINDTRARAGKAACSHETVSNEMKAGG